MSIFHPRRTPLHTMRRRRSFPSPCPIRTGRCSCARSSTCIAVRRTSRWKKGGRTSGTFTVSPYQWGQSPIPTSVGVWYGRGNSDADKLARTDRPWVNGIELVGGTHWPNPEDWATFRPVENVHARTASGRESSVHVPDRTQHRTGTIVLALLGHYMTHPLRPVLQRAFAEYIAGRRLNDLASSERHVRSKISAKLEAIRLLEEELDRYTQLKVELRELADSFIRRTGGDLAGPVGGAA